MTMPTFVSPMLAVTGAAPFDDKDWLFEIKWDGYRAIAEAGGRGARLYSRNRVSFAQRYPSLVAALKKLGRRVVLDGEIVCLDGRGKPSFQMLQQFPETGKGRLRYMAFDILRLDGRDVRHEPLVARKQLLRGVLRGSKDIAYADHVATRGREFFRAAKRAGLEGIVAKHMWSPYHAGIRSEKWVKLKTVLRQETVIAGFTEPRRTREHIGALILGVYDGDDLVYVGHAGTGFDRKNLAALYAKLAARERKTSPFRILPPTNSPAHWVRPDLVCEVRFAEWTKDGHMRMPVFVGLRDDKSAKDVHRERPHRL